MLLAAPVKNRDILGVRLRPRVRQVAELPGADLRDEVPLLRHERPAIAAEIVEIEVQAAADVLVEVLRRAARGPGVHLTRCQRPFTEDRAELRRTDADE